MSDAPDILTGDDGETVFIRRDLAQTPIQARAYALAHDGQNLAGYVADEVEMCEVPTHFTGIDMDWATVKPGTAGATRYWRFRL